MGFIRPQKGEKHRVVVELEGTSKKLTPKNFEAYKKAIEKAVKEIGAKIVTKEHISIKKKAPK
jgi:hypothetical protein